MEKEALGVTWFCEQVKDVLTGRHFSLEPDHKPLVSLSGHQVRTKLPLRIHPFHLTRYSYTIFHTPGKALITADMLSQTPVSQNTNLKDSNKSLMANTNIYVNELVNNLSTSSTYFTQLREKLTDKSVCANSFCQRD